MDPQADVEWLRSAVWTIRGVDPGPLAPSQALADLDLVGVDLLVCVGLLEDTFGIDFPADLLAVLESVDDLLHYAAVKQSHKTGRGSTVP